LKGEIWRHLSERYTHLTARIESDVAEALKAFAGVDSSVDSPFWLVLNETSPTSDILVCENGLVHLPSLVANDNSFFWPTSPRLFALSRLPYEFDPSAPRPDSWLAFLAQVLPGDPVSIQTLQEWCGYLLTPNTSQQKMLVAIGAPRSGRGTIVRVLSALVGRDNVVGPTVSSLSTNFGLQSLVGKSLAVFNDVRLGRHTDHAVLVERLLSITGEDTQTIPCKYKSDFTCKLPTRLILVSNELPRFCESSGALVGRMVLLRFRESFLGRENPGLTDALLAELPGIVLWAIEGWRRLRERGRFLQPESGQELLHELADLASPVRPFVNERCCVGSDFSVPCKALWEAWKNWCSSNGQQESSAQVLGRNLRAIFPSLTAPFRRDQYGHNVRTYLGIGLVR
jgi:putative DNA primase/helicase